MQHSQDKLFVCILNCPYLNWQDKKTQQVFSQMISLKLDGYIGKHRFGVMPIDGTDFVADHILICRGNPDGDFTPILGVKSLRYELCKPFHIDFTIEAFLKKGGHQEHLLSLFQILANGQQAGKNIAYYSSWTIAKEARQDRELISHLKELFTAMTVLFHKNNRTDELLGLGVPKYRTDEFFHTWGFERVQWQSRPLENIPFLILDGIDGVFIHLKDYKPLALNLAERHFRLWENRLEVGQRSDFSQIQQLQTEANSTLPPIYHTQNNHRPNISI